MRILQLVDTLEAGGAEKLAVEFSNSLSSLGHTVHLCATRHFGSLEKQLSPDVLRLAINRTARWSVRPFFHLLRYLECHEIQIIHAHASGSNYWARVVKKLSRNRVVVVAHNHDGRSVSQRNEWFSRLCYGGCDLFIAVSNVNQVWAREHLGIRESQAILMPNGIDCQRYRVFKPAGLRERLSLKGNVFIIVQVANFRKEKNHILMLRALRNLNRRNVVLVFVGSDADANYAGEVRDYIDRYRLSQRVFLLGPQSNIPGILAESDAGVVSSNYESGPLVVAEYLAAGLPFITTDTGLCVQILKDVGWCAYETPTAEQPGMLVAPGDSEGLQRAMDAVSALPQSTRNAIRRSGLGKAETVFDIKSRVKELVCCYERLLNGKLVPSSRYSRGFQQ